MGKETFIRLRGVRQHNLKGLNLNIHLNGLIAITGISGSGKSSLAYYTLYAEGQRRYIETFSPYARQFLERIDPPKAERIEGIPPAMAIESGTTVRSARSTVGTITEIVDYLKYLYERLAEPYCPECGKPINRDTPESIVKKLRCLPKKARILITFPCSTQGSPKWSSFLISQGFIRIFHDGHIINLEEQPPDDRL